MKKLRLILGLLLLPLLSLAQTFEGSIVDEETKNLVSNAIVSIEGTEIFATADLDGNFSIDEEIPRGEQVVIITKNGYEDHYFLIEVIPGQTVSAKNISLEMTKDEKKRRKKLRKAKEKEEEERQEAEEDRLKEARKRREQEEKEKEKALKEARKNSEDIDIGYENPGTVVSTKILVDEPLESNNVDTVTPIQVKYSAILGVTPEEITNVPLYYFIDEWMGTAYKMGGANKEGIDCSSFAQRLFTSVYDMYIERTAQKQFDSKYTEKFKGKEYIKEGDLIFFGESEYSISHVGIYLGNNLFVNATSRRGSTGVSGVKISNLSEVYWTNQFICAGRRIVKDN